ncbi:MAG: hypothetical protein SPJ06_04540, partial [Bacilli bacterium]|nr:hypothetical protein [Bacilli bacterium]
EEKKERTSKVTIWALVIVLILALGYIAYDKGLIFSNPSSNTDISDKDDNAGNKKEEDENKDYITKLEVNDSIVLDSFSKMAGFSCFVNKYYYTDSKVTSSSFGNEFVYKLASLNVEKMYGKVDITEAQFDNAVSNIFGSNYKYNHIAYTNVCTRYIYNPNTKVYVYQKQPVCDDSSFSCNQDNPDLLEIVGAYKDDKTLTIELGVLFATDNGNNTYTYYKDYKRTQIVTDYERVDGSNIAKNTIENAKKGAIYNMVFTLENGNYVYSYTEPSGK